MTWDGGRYPIVLTVFPNELPDSIQTSAVASTPVLSRSPKDDGSARCFQACQRDDVQKP
jgi:hypothetical protein